MGRRDMLRLSSKTFPAVGELRRWAFGRCLVGRSHGALPLQMPVVFEGRRACPCVSPCRAMLWISLRLIRGIRNALALGPAGAQRRRAQTVSSGLLCALWRFAVALLQRSVAASEAGSPRARRCVREVRRRGHTLFDPAVQRAPPVRAAVECLCRCSSLLFAA